MEKRHNPKKLIFFSVILLLVFAIIFSGLQILESTVFYDRAKAGEQMKTKTIRRDGVSYFPRQDITTVMLLGIDQDGPVVSSGTDRNPGMADAVMLAIFDETNQTIDVLAMNRDTMVDVPILDSEGNPAGSHVAQLSLSHAYGSGMQDSCENTRTALSNLLYGIKIDYYVSINMDAIAILNDAVGGVTVNVTADFSEVDPSIKMGEMTLHGDQAIHFIRYRKNVGDQLALTRVGRQREYISGFLKAMGEDRMQDATFIMDTYDAVSPYMVTDCSVNTISDLMEKVSAYTVDRIVSPEGENVLGEQYYEFYVDEEKLDTLILDLFYAPKE